MVPFLFAFILTCFGTPIEKRNEEKLLFVLEASGIMQESETAHRLFELYTQKLGTRPKGLNYVSYQKYVANFIKSKLSNEELLELHQLFQDPFLKKIAKVVYSDFVEDKKFHLFVNSQSHLANKKRFMELQKLNQIFIWGPGQEYGVKTLEQLIIAKELISQGQSVTSKFFEKKVEAQYEKKFTAPADDLRRKINQAIYYKTNDLRFSELLEFNRKYKDNQGLKNFYKLHLKAYKTYFNKLYLAQTGR